MNIDCVLINFQLHRHALLNSKRGVSVDENGKQLDDEISIISSQVCLHKASSALGISENHIAIPEVLQAAVQPSYQKDCKRGVACRVGTPHPAPQFLFNTEKALLLKIFLPIMPS